MATLCFCEMKSNGPAHSLTQKCVSASDSMLSHVDFTFAVLYYSTYWSKFTPIIDGN